MASSSRGLALCLTPPPRLVLGTSKMAAARRQISFLLQRPTIANNAELQNDLEHAIHNVKAYDPAGYLPGLLLRKENMSITYYAVRSFWVETGLRFGSTAKVDPNDSPLVHLEWWQQGIDHVYSEAQDLPPDYNHPTLRLLRDTLVKNPSLQKAHFDDILMGRRQDLDLKQYPTVQSLIDHALLSCGSLSRLVLESGNVTSPKAYEAAQHVGVAHGLTNALRTSIPVISTTGKLVVPQDLCTKYGVKSPRYILSTLGLGDTECRAAFSNAVRDIANVARDNLQQARALRQDLLLEQPDGDKAVAVLIPGLVSETFLDRLEESGYDLTNRNLRNVGFMEYAMCAGRMIRAYYQKQY